MGTWDKARSHNNALPLIGGIFEGIWGSPEHEESVRTQRRIQEEMEAQRPERAEQRMRAMQSSLEAFRPMSEYMRGAYGQDAALDVGNMATNPLVSPNSSVAAFRPGTEEYNIRRAAEEAGRMPYTGVMPGGAPNPNLAFRPENK